MSPLKPEHTVDVRDLIRDSDVSGIPDAQLDCAAPKNVTVPSFFPTRSSELGMSWPLASPLKTTSGDSESRALHLWPNLCHINSLCLCTIITIIIRFLILVCREVTALKF